jgi:hypothetical protein
MIPTWKEADERIESGNGTELDFFVRNREPGVLTMDVWRKDLEAVLEETRLKENIRLRTIFQDYVSFLPENHLKDLIEKLK